MAGERCNLDKDEAELLKPASSSSPPPPPPPPTSSPPPPPQPSHFHSPPQEFSPQIAKVPETEAPAIAIASEAIAVAATVVSNELESPVRYINRCSSCNKKVGLTGFRCRCGELFCGVHRYSDVHDCSFDYKAFGREEIMKNNPVVRAAKIIKI